MESVSTGTEVPQTGMSPAALSMKFVSVLHFRVSVLTEVKYNVCTIQSVTFTNIIK